MRLKDEIKTWDGATVLGVGVMVATTVLAAVIVLGSQLWALLAGTSLPWNPVRLALMLWRGNLEMSWSWWACCALVVVLPLVLWLWVRRARRGKGRRRVRGDQAAHRTGKPGDTRSLMPVQARAKAERLGVTSKVCGLPVGRAVRTGKPLVTDFESVCTGVAGPRTGKTTCWVIPRILVAPGAVVSTSNKRDVVDATREARQEQGRCWVFDPQGIADEPQRWWWNIMDYVTDAVSARALAEIFQDTTRPPEAQVSAYFDAAARDLVACLLLAAARSGRPLTELHTWLNDLNDDEPVVLLKDAGENLSADTLRGIMALVPETRSGVYGSASTMMSFLLNAQAIRWVTPSPWLEQLDPREFVKSTDTLFALSQEGRGSATPIVTALTVAVTEAAVEHAKTQPAGRLSVPMLIELDEAANVCKWRELPDMYSHFGSRGICVDTVLQSWSQGVTAWGEAGMKKLWSASNVKVYAGGVSERAFLSDLSELIGSWWADSIQVSHSSQGQSTSRSLQSQQRNIATVSDLQALPPGRAWVFASGATPVLAELVPWWRN
ncbi:conjugal transfer coupling protein TraG [Actinomyces bovis]|uniref:Conjugal transfer coupling protein TraG n=1 Tax=Actinomyces bovis TaxID=1658 RepID=A0ABY1VPV7_9ACTO|nr:type IV secretory system conjugative DNA transfer family protein [Actinomyces bovis]SPT53472.1 conjugal transfer coupling protein TraG [Actinomyces bovis]VEG55344.1 conjugal transfer coupling protein TraG [Actinomyces israelii]